MLFATACWEQAVDITIGVVVGCTLDWVDITFARILLGAVAVTKAGTTVEKERFTWAVTWINDVFWDVIVWWEVVLAMEDDELTECTSATLSTKLFCDISEAALVDIINTWYDIETGYTFAITFK